MNARTTRPALNGYESLLLIEASPGSLAEIAGFWPDVRPLRLALDEAVSAPDLISRHDIGLIVCDLAARSPEGLAALATIRRVHSHLPILAVFAVRDFDLALGAFRAGADDLLVRPLAEQAVHQALEQALAKRRAQAQFDQAQRQAEETLDDLVLLRTVGETASREEDLQRLLERIVTSIASTLDVEIVSIMLTDSNGELEMRAARGLPEEVRRSTRLAPGEGIAGHVLSQGEPVLINDLATDGRFMPSGAAGRYRTGSLLSVPIRYQNRVLGVLNVNNKRSGEGFVAHDQELLLMIAHQAALAIENFALVGTLHDRTRQLEEAHTGLIRLHEGRTRFVCNLSHELKTPLTSVLGFADLLINFYDQFESEQVYEYLQGIYAEAVKLEKLLSGMLRLFSIDSGSENWAWQELPLDGPVQTVLDELAGEISAKQLHTEVQRLGTPAPVWGDPEKISLLLHCLCDNAVKFNRPDGCLEIRIEDRQVEGLPMVSLTICNDGEAIPAEAAEEIFEAYAQLGELDTGKPHGVGIGLPTCRAILRQLRGRIALVPRPEDGTCFHILLPTRAAYQELDDDTSAY